MTHNADPDEVRGWFAGRIPDGWFTQAPEVVADGEEILVVGRLSPASLPDDATAAARTAAERSRIDGFREETRQARVRIAQDAQHRFRRRVSWGAECGETRVLFTTVATPVMTRLRMPGRAVLDTLIDAGVARSRSEALAWCVRLVGKNQSEWISSLREALTHVEKVRAEGPDSA